MRRWVPWVIGAGGAVGLGLLAWVLRLAGDEEGPDSGAGGEAMPPQEAGSFARGLAELTAVAQANGISPAVLRAILRVESGGRALGPDGRPVVRFEHHVFARRSREAGREIIVLLPGMPGYDRWRAGATKADLDQIARNTRPAVRSGEPHSGILDSRIGRLRRTSQADEWTHGVDLAARAAQQAGISPDLAWQSASYGGGQQMGFHFRRLGYASAEAMARAYRDPGEQLRAMARFFLTDPQLLDAARRQDWRRLARIYNGAEEPWGSRIAQAYEREREVA